MPVTLTIDPKRRLTITTGEGLVTDDDLIRAREQVLADASFDPLFDRIWDFYAVTEARVTEDVVARLVAASPNSDKPIYRAVVVSERASPMKPILDFIKHTRQANRRIAAFPRLDDAEQWIAASRADQPPKLASLPPR